MLLICILVLICSAALALTAYTAIAAVPTRELDVNEIHSIYRDQTLPPSRLTLNSTWRWTVRRAQFDHFVHPVEELRGYHIIHFIHAYRVGDEILLEFAPNTSDAYVLYRCAANGKILWRAYFFDGA